MRSVQRTTSVTSSARAPRALRAAVTPDEASERSAPTTPLSAPAYDRLAQVATQIAEYARIAANLPTLDTMESPVVMVTTRRTLAADLDTAICELAEAIVREVSA